MGKKLLIVGTLISLPVLVVVGFFVYLEYFVPQQDALTFTVVETDKSNTVDFDQWRSDRELERAALKQKKEQEEAEALGDTFTMFVAGDVMLSRTVELKMKAKGNNYCFEAMQPLIAESDIAIANLESPILNGPMVEAGSTVFRAPDSAVDALQWAGFDLMSVANNHFGDQGQSGMLNTFEQLKKKGIDYVGGGVKNSEMHNPLIRDVKGVKVAFLGYGYGPDYYGATDDKAGMALMDIEQMKKDVAEANLVADLVIVTMHDGIEYVTSPTNHQQEFAQTAIDAGADLIFGHHPHWVQTMEIYKEKYIFYSLGNFVFDQMWSEETKQGMSIVFTMNKEGVKDLVYHPVYIQDFCKPSLATGGLRDDIIERL